MGKSEIEHIIDGFDKLQNSREFYIFINICRILSLIGIIALLIIFFVYHEEIIDYKYPCVGCMADGYECYIRDESVGIGNIHVSENFNITISDS